MALSLTQPGIQGIPDRKMAIDTAKRMNDELALMVEAHPKQFLGFAAVPLQDVRAACDELDRCVSKLGFKGVLINGYSNIGDMNTAQYLDEAPVWDFWARVDALGVPVYLHPRPPLMSQRRAYEGYEVLARFALGFWRRNFLALAASDPERVVRPLSPAPGHSRPPGRGTSLPSAAGRASAAPHEPASAREAAEAGHLLPARELLHHHRRPFPHSGLHRHDA